MTSTDVSKTFNEEETVEADKASDLYSKSRILLEKTAFDFIKELPGRSTSDFFRHTSVCSTDQSNLPLCGQNTLTNPETRSQKLDLSAQLENK